MVHEDTASQSSFSAADSDTGSVCSSDYQYLPPGLVPDLANMTGVNLDNCTETHVGPKINFNFVLNGNEDDTERVLRPINRMLAVPNVFQKVFNDEKLGAVPSAPYKSDESLPSGFRDEGKIDPPGGNGPKKFWHKPKRPCVLGVCAAVLLVGAGLAGGIYYASVHWWRDSGTTNSSTPTPPTSTPSNPPTVTVPFKTDIPTSTNRTPIPTPSPVTPSISGQVYEKWGQVTPPDKYLRSHTDLFTRVALDNLPGARCSSYENCTAILKQAQKAASGESLNYNYLIDDSGNMYYARGYMWYSDDDPQTARVAFIGSYKGSESLTDAQIHTLSRLIFDHPSQISSDVRLEAQCIRNIENETGPDRNVICDVESSALISHLKHPIIGTAARTGSDGCAWGPNLLEC